MVKHPIESARKNPSVSSTIGMKRILLLTGSVVLWFGRGSVLIQSHDGGLGEKSVTQAERRDAGRWPHRTVLRARCGHRWFRTSCNRVRLPRGFGATHWQCERFARQAPGSRSSRANVGMQTSSFPQPEELQSVPKWDRCLRLYLI